MNRGGGRTWDCLFSLSFCRISRWAGPEEPQSPQWLCWRFHSRGECELGEPRVSFLGQGHKGSVGRQPAQGWGQAAGWQGQQAQPCTHRPPLRPRLTPGGLGAGSDLCSSRCEHPRSVLVVMYDTAYNRRRPAPRETLGSLLYPTLSLLLTLVWQNSGDFAGRFCRHGKQDARSSRVCVFTRFTQYLNSKVLFPT